MSLTFNDLFWWGYVLVGIVHVGYCCVDCPWPRAITKVLLMPLLMMAFGWTSSMGSVQSYGVLCALLFSWWGDIALLFKHGARYFIGGVASFALAHLVYLLVMLTLIDFSVMTGSLWIGYAIVLFLVLPLYWRAAKEWLGNRVIYLFIYSVLLLCLGLFSVWVYQSYPVGIGVLVGAHLFIVSDFLLMLNQFRGKHRMLNVAVMLTYIMAQLLMSYGFLMCIA